MRCSLSGTCRSLLLLLCTVSAAVILLYSGLGLDEQSPALVLKYLNVSKTQAAVPVNEYKFPTIGKTCSLAVTLIRHNPPFSKNVYGIYFLDNFPNSYIRFRISDIEPSWADEKDFKRSRTVFFFHWNNDLGFENES